MKNLMVLAAVLAASACAVRAQEEAGSPLSFDATADVYSAYVWRGMVLDKHAVLQPSAKANLNLGDAGTISAKVWMNWDISQKSGHAPQPTRTGGGINELDFWLSYSIDVGPVSLDAGHIWYTFPGNSWPNHSYSTEEVYLRAAYNNDVITPYIGVWYDYNFADGFYGKAGLSKEVKVNDRLAVGGDLSLGAGASHFVAAYTGNAVHDGALADANAKLYTSFKLNDTFAIGATLAYTYIVDSDLRDLFNAAGSDNFIGHGGILWGGINLSASF